MKNKTSKYIAAIIIVIGILFICSIPFMVGNSTNWPTLADQNKSLSYAQGDSGGDFQKTLRAWTIDPILSRNRYAGIDGELKQLFKEAEVVYLVDNIKLVQADKKYTRTKMYGTIVGIINKNNIPIRYNIGDQECIGYWFNAPSEAIVPEGAILFLQSGPNKIYNAGNTVYFNYGQLARKYNGYTFEYIKEIFNQDEK